ncbi:hypothetical protein ACFBZI_11240 [Moraxella sp. ZJ142]|uniref:hypothetical protein n=1 Tax=Moraxella marmotae TaxID=3344520 RepID=UPI0035D45601
MSSASNKSLQIAKKIAKTVREVTYDKRSQVASLDYERVLADTTDKTKAAYLARFKGAWASKTRAGVPPSLVFNALIADLVDKRAAGELKHASLRQYRAAFQYVLALLSQIHQTKGETGGFGDDFLGQIAPYYNLAQIDILSGRLLAIGGENSDELRQREQQAHRLNQTSTKKRKDFPLAIAELLQADTLPSRQLLRDFIEINMIFGLRPVEWFSAKLQVVDGQLQATPAGLGDAPLTDEFAQAVLSSLALDLKGYGLPYALIVNNAKNTHGRACGAVRTLYFDLPKDKLDALKRVLVGFESVEIGGEKQFLENLGKSLKRFIKNHACQKLLRSDYKKRLREYNKRVNQAKEKGKQVNALPPVYTEPTLYSTRHQAIANAKVAGLHPVCIAALFGHVSVITADRHYAHSSRGVGGFGLAPDVVNVLEVINEMTASQLLAVAPQVVAEKEAQLAVAEKEKAVTKRLTPKASEPDLGVSFGSL